MAGILSPSTEDMNVSPSFSGVASFSFYASRANATNCQLAVEFVSFEVVVFGLLNTFINAVGFVGNVLSLVVLAKGKNVFVCVMMEITTVS